MPIYMQVTLTILFFVWLIGASAVVGMILEGRYKNLPPPSATRQAVRNRYLDWANSPYEKKGFWWSYPKWVDKITQ